MEYAKVWFGGNFMCTEEDLVYLDGYIFNGLKRIANAKRADVEIKDKELLFSYFYNRLSNIDDDTIHGYLVGFGTASDDFIIFAYLDDNNVIHLLWKLYNTKTYFKDLSRFDRGVHYFSIGK